MKIEKFQQEWQELTQSSTFHESHPFWVNGIKNSMEEPHEWVDHEEHSIRYVLKECAEQFYENQALDFFPRKLELFFEDSHSPMEEWDGSTQFGPANNEKFVAISLITEGCIHAKMVHISFPLVLDSATPMGNERWVKKFFCFVSHVHQGYHDLSPWCFP